MCDVVRCVWDCVSDAVMTVCCRMAFPTKPREPRKTINTCVHPISCACYSCLLNNLVALHALLLCSFKFSTAARHRSLTVSRDCYEVASNDRSSFLCVMGDTIIRKGSVTAWFDFV